MKPRGHLRIALSLVGAAALLAVGATVALAAPSRATDNNGSVRAALEKTGKVPSGHFTFTLNITGGSGQLPAGGVTLAGSGGFDTKHKSGDFKLDLGSLANIAGATTGGQVPQTIEVRVVNNVIYAYLPSFAKTLGPGKQWLKLDPSTLPQSSTTAGIDPKQLTGINPQAALTKLIGSVTTHRLGSARVRGSSTSHYQVNVDLAKVVTILPHAQQAAALKGLEQTGVKSLPIDVYVDGSGYVRRIGVTLSNLTVQAGQAPASIALTLDFFDFRARVSVHAPPDAQVADAGPLLAQLAGGLGTGGKHP